jgi:hypothetical protein
MAASALKLDVQGSAAKREPTLLGGRIDRGCCDVSELVQCILLEIQPVLVYLSTDKFAEAPT